MLKASQKSCHFLRDDGETSSRYWWEIYTKCENRNANPPSTSFLSNCTLCSRTLFLFYIAPRACTCHPRSSSPPPVLHTLDRHIFYLGKFVSVGTWQVRWNTLGHFSQHRSSPPFWQTAHQSSLGSSSFLVSPTCTGDFWEASGHSDFPFEEFSWWSAGWSPVLSGASDRNTVSSEAELWLLFRRREVSMLLG